MLNCCVLVCMFQPEIAFFSQNRGGTSSIHTHLGPRRGSPGKSTQGGRAGGSGNRGATVTGASCRPPTPPRAHALAWLKSLASSANGKCCQILCETNFCETKSMKWISIITKNIFEKFLFLKYFDKNEGKIYSILYEFKQSYLKTFFVLYEVHYFYFLKII